MFFPIFCRAVPGRKAWASTTMCATGTILVKQDGRGLGGLWEPGGATAQWQSILVAGCVSQLRLLLHMRTAQAAHPGAVGGVKCLDGLPTEICFSAQALKMFIIFLNLNLYIFLLLKSVNTDNLI